MVKFEQQLQVDETKFETPKEEQQQEVVEKQKKQVNKKVLFGGIATGVLVAILSVIVGIKVINKDDTVALPTDNIHQTQTVVKGEYDLEDYTLADLGVYSCLDEVWLQIIMPSGLYEQPSTAGNSIATLQEEQMLQVLNRVVTDDVDTGWVYVKNPVDDTEGFLYTKNAEIIPGYTKSLYDIELRTGLKIRENIPLTKEQYEILSFGDAIPLTDEEEVVEEEVIEDTKGMSAEKEQTLVANIQHSRNAVSDREQKEKEKIDKITEYLLNNNLGHRDGDKVYANVGAIPNSNGVTFSLDTNTPLTKTNLLYLYDFIYGRN